jgi:hypothetical protein
MTNPHAISPVLETRSSVNISTSDLRLLFERTIGNVREDMRDNPYIGEALRVLPVGGFRSAIGSFWNAVVDDLRNKIAHRSLTLFNKSVAIARDIKTYEDFQNHVTDDQLIDGAYKIGVIGWEASKVLRHAKETRHIFDGHPKSSEPSPVKVLAMMEDCIKYVLNEPYPVAVVDLDEYIARLGEPNFDRNEVAVENALCDLPDIYKNELTNRLYTVYTHEAASTILRSNIEFALPILWRVLPKDVKLQVVRRVDQLISNSNAERTALAFSLVQVVGAGLYLSPVARKYRVEPLLTSLETKLDDWRAENEIVRELAPYASVIPPDLVQRYVRALTKTYVGYTGSSMQFARTDFYADGAAIEIPKMFEAFDDRAAASFVEVVRTDTLLRGRLDRPPKLKRLRSLTHVVIGRVSESFQDRDFLQKLVDEPREAEFWAELGKKKSSQ